jgi:formate dehydrogenase maturation protein FdhE
MKIRCKVCGEFFNPDEETVELVSEGFIDSASVNTCDDCWVMLKHLYEDTEEMISDADPGL